ncbi:MAG TPA: hypothetical protein VJ721_04350 [Chthoniobacterales bacterium]|nr:hypothetical protein [Chthoniobacterales bacterium]
MTARDQLNRRQRRLAIALYSGFALAIVSSALGWFLQSSPKSDLLLVPLVIGIAMAMVCMCMIQFGIRCAVCRLRLGHVLLATGHIWGFGNNFNFCPKCGTSFDQEVSP